MIKTILVCTDGSPSGEAACEYAVTLAKRLKARLTGLHVLDSRMLEGPLMADISGWLGAQPFSAQIAQFRNLMETKGQAVIDAFKDLCEKHGIPAEARMRTGLPPRVILDEEQLGISVGDDEIDGATFATVGALSDFVHARLP